MEAKAVTVASMDAHFEWSGDCPEPEYPFQPYELVQFGPGGEVVNSIGGVYLNVEEGMLAQVEEVCAEYDICAEHILIK